jgi:hypothetical protein
VDPRAFRGTSSVEFLRLLSLQAVDSQAAHRATTLALTPFAALSISVSLIGLAVSSVGPGSGATSLITLFLTGVALMRAISLRFAQKGENVSFSAAQLWRPFGVLR